jgi:UDP-N-acetylmuramate dehydrogenase
VDGPDEHALIDAVTEADSRRVPLLLLAGGSNLVIADEGFPGTVVRVATRGVEPRAEGDRTVLRVQAGEPWDGVVSRCVREGLVGIECLSGIPGSAGATPIQNVGAYGQEVRGTIVGVRVFDRALGQVRDLAPQECGFAYRSSVFKRAPGRWVVLSVDFALAHGEISAPLRYPELARALGVAPGDSAPIAEVREAVLGLRRAKGMVLDPRDPDTTSAGSFFLNPVLSAAEFDRLTRRVHNLLGPDSHPPAFPSDDRRVKTSAAWLIERAGFHRGYGDPEGIAISSKHTLALTNRGRGTSARLVALAAEIAAAVHDRFGVQLVPEPVFAGPHSLPAGNVMLFSGASGLTG